ncbi:MAG: cytochrome b/b6 domain-containing protein [Rhodospirillaceae bacterium]
MDIAKKARTKRVWDVLVRVFHWTLVIGFFIAYFSEGEPLSQHIWAGYVVGMAVVLRIVWGFIGTPHARFSDFVFPAGRVLSYLADEVRFRARRFPGHSPAGDAMVIALMFMLLATTTSGMILLAVHEGQGPLLSFIGKADEHASTSSRSPSSTRESEEDRENPAVELWEEAHELLANLTLLLVILHVGGVLLASYAHKENLIAVMLDGRKRPLP